MKLFTSPKSAAKMLPCLLIMLLCLLAAAGRPDARAQQQQQPPKQDEADEVLRVSTNLVQTDVTVLDKQGRPVTDLRPEQFTLTVDGREQPLLFFERVTAGGAGESAALHRSSRGEPAAARAAAPDSSSARGRSIIFFVDDLHLSPEGAARARDILYDYIDRRLAPGTLTLISSASGQVGFLQQFTDDRAVLRAAARRIRYQAVASNDDQEQPPMSERTALEIERGNRNVLDYYVQSLIRDRISRTPPRRDTAEQMVRDRARTIISRASYVSEATIKSLETAVGALGPVPGRRVLFFISEGFVFNNRARDINHKFRRVIDAAARAGTVIYTLDARGLAVPLQDAASKMRADIEFDADLTVINPSADMTATQEVLRGLAAETGGRALLNTNGLEQAVEHALGETAEYYVLAWKPEAVETRNGAPNFRRIEVAVKGRPDLTVRVRNGLLDARAEVARQPTAGNAPGDAASKTAAATPNAALNAALAAPAERRALPIDLYAVYNGDAQSAPALTTLVQLADDPVEFAPAGDKLQAEVSVACVVLDDAGKPVFSDGRTLTLTRGSASAPPSKIVAQFPAQLTKPGLYQVRVAARDNRSGRTGSAFQWVEIPDLKSGRLALSTPVVVETRGTGAGPATPAVSLKVDRRFARSSRMLLELYVYNAARQSGASEVEMEIRVSRGGRVALAAPPHKLSMAGSQDPARVRYSAELPLGSLSPGVYTLEIAAAERASKTSATRQLTFAVE